MNAASTDVTRLNHVLGARPESGDQTRFCVWSPTCARVEVRLLNDDRIVALSKTDGGYHVGVVEGVTAGHRYMYRFDGSPDRPDPASRYQPDGVHGPSMVVGEWSDWSDQKWQCRRGPIG